MSHSPTILERTLPNGLRVILRESHDAPVASFWVWYRAGARNEGPGITGVSHWVEHMQFKGTPSLGKGAIFAEISRNGGYNNAMTSNDWTAYYETLPADRVELAVRIEADRMSNSLFDPEEVESERTVILSEQQGAENNPGYVLYKEVVGSAFRAHPYGKMVIGYERDLETMTRADLYDYYRRAYVPNNAFIVAAGDFDATALMATIEAAFGSIPAGEPMPPVRVEEEPQLGERRVTLRRPAPTSYLRIGFHTPAANHPDTAAILVADAVLAGAKGMGIAGGGPMGRSARLYRALVAAGLARTAGSGFDFFLDPYLLMIDVTAIPGVDPDLIERTVDAELARIASEPVGADELARALKQVKAQYVYSGEGVTNQAFWLGQMELVGDYRRATSFIDEIEQVTADDVLRVARAYLRKENRTVGWLLPESAGNGAEANVEVRPSAIRLWGINGPHAPVVNPGANRAPFERRVLSNGIVLLGQAQPDDPSLVIRFRTGAGSTADPAGRHGLAALTARSLARGTTTRRFEEVNEFTDGLGASLSVEPGTISTDIRLRFLSEDTAQVIALAADLIRNPTFPSTEVDKVRAEMIAAIREQENDTRASSDRAVRRLLFPEGHPLHHRVLGDADSLGSLSSRDLVAFHAASFGPRNLTVSAVGGFRILDDIAEILEASFGDWTSAAARQRLDLSTAAPASAARAEVTIPGKSQADIAMAFPAISRLDPTYQAFDMANLILGRLGLMGRLGANVRDRQGLAYYAYSSVEPGRDGSIWLARAGVDPRNVERAIAGIEAEVARLRAESISADELDDGKRYLTGVLPLALESNDGISGLLLSIEHFDLGLDHVDRYPALVEAITANDIAAAARANLDETRLQIGIARPA
ncbi:MAG: insulinase family protein [Thermomicrobiales bacterium]|nr:insulinase family protein [Thermomicrobiales bacterium]